MNAAVARTVVAAALQLAALVALALALAGVAGLDPHARPQVLVLVDRSQSMPGPATDEAVARVAQAAQAAGAAQVETLAFAGRPAAAAGTAAPAAIDPSATDIEEALQAALARHARSPWAGVVLVSDGHANRGDTERGLQALRAAGLPLHLLAVGRPPPAVRLAGVLAPAQARVGQPLRVGVRLDGAGGRALRVRASTRSATGATGTATADSSGTGVAELTLDAGSGGPLVLDLALEDPATGQVLDSLPDAAVVDVLPRAPLLYLQGSPGPLADSLARGGWTLHRAPSARADAYTDALAGYQAVVLDDVAIGDASPRFWAALVAAVQQRGLGLVVLGGERSFTRGGYRGSLLESVLPLRAEPPALDEPAAVVFAVDKSGSMGQGSAGVDRFQLAQRAVLQTARGLGERDALGLVVFDVAPRVLIPLGPAAAGTAALARDWPASPQGGTRLAPALEAAIAELETAGAARRLLVLVTDGFVDGAPLAALRARLARARVELIALAVGPDADVAALQQVVAQGAGQVLRVDQAAELPQVMSAGLERRRARVERGPIEVEQTRALPFAPGTLAGWPAVGAHPVTRPQPDAVVGVQTRRGEPLLAWRQAGRGAVVAVASGLGGWAPRWVAWREWPRLAGGLVEWAGAAAAGSDARLRVADRPEELRVEVEAEGGGTAGAPAATLAADTPASAGQPLALQAVAPGRLQALLPAAGGGLYTFWLNTAQGPRRHLHLRRERAEAQAYGVNPAFKDWQAAGLVQPWTPDFLARRVERAGRGELDRGWVALALGLAVAGVLVDRQALAGLGTAWAALSEAVRRRRARARRAASPAR